MQVRNEQCLLLLPVNRFVSMEIEVLLVEVEKHRKFVDSLVLLEVGIEPTSNNQSLKGRKIDTGNFSPF